MVIDQLKIISVVGGHESKDHVDQEQKVYAIVEDSCTHTVVVEADVYRRQEAGEDQHHRHQHVPVRLASVLRVDDARLVDISLDHTCLAPATLAIVKHRDFIIVVLNGLLDRRDFG